VGVGFPVLAKEAGTARLGTSWQWDALFRSKTRFKIGK